MKNMAVMVFALLCNTMFVCLLLLSSNTVYNGIMCMAGVTLSILLSLYELDNKKKS